MSDNSIVTLNETDKFSDWFTKINKVIDNLKDKNDEISDLESYIEEAISRGLLTTAAEKETADECLHSGFYCIPNQQKKDFLFVVANVNALSQIKISNDKIYFRSGTITNNVASFNNSNYWIELPSTSFITNTYFPISGGTITGDLTVDEDTTLKGYLYTKGRATFTDLIKLQNNIESEAETLNVLKIKNESENVIFDGCVGYIDDSTIPTHTLYYVDEEKKIVTTDQSYTNEIYKIEFSNNGLPTHLIRNNVVYYRQTHLDTLKSLKDDINYFYIQSDGRITITKNDTIAVYYKDNNIVLNSKRDEIVFYIINNKLYAQDTAYYIDENKVYKDEESVFHIEDSFVIEDRKIGIISNNVVTSPTDSNKVIYYVHNTEDGTIYLSNTDEDNIEQASYFIKNNYVYTDKEYQNIIYYIDDSNVIIDKSTSYYIHTRDDEVSSIQHTIWTTDEEGENVSFYVYDNKVLNIKPTPLYEITSHLDTLSTDREGKSTVFYIQPENTEGKSNVTSDKIGIYVVYVIYTEKNKKYVSSIYSPSFPVFYIDEQGNFFTKKIYYYIQSEVNGAFPVTRDENGIFKEYDYKRDSTNPQRAEIINDTMPININLATNVCNINGNAKTADELNPRGLTQSFVSGEDNLAASGKALSGLNDHITGTYMPFTGGIFNGVVKYNEDIIMLNDSKVCSTDKLGFQSFSEVNFVINNSLGEFYIDKAEDESTIKHPCIISARTRTGITDNDAGTVLHNLGSIEFSDDYTRIRSRKENASEVVGGADSYDISLYLKKDSFYPDKDNEISLGTATNRFKQLYASTGSITTSDETSKTSIKSINKSLLKEWKNVEWKSYKLKSSVNEKGDKARTHTGLIAQDLSKIISNAKEYGFFCEDDGKLSLRYQELQAIENAYLREEIKNLQKEIDNLKKKIK